MGAYGTYISMAFSIGMTIYNWVSSDSDKPEKPKPQEIQLNNYTRNAPVPICYGTDSYAGTVIFIGNTWVEDTSSYDNTDSGSKGSLLSMFMPSLSGDGSEGQTSYKYFAEFAIAFGEGEFITLIDVFVNNDTLLDKYDGLDYVMYLGTDDQNIDSFCLDFLGSDAIPFKDTSYISLSGSLGEVNQVPILSAEVAGLFAYGSIGIDPAWNNILNLNTGYNAHTMWETDEGVYHSFVNSNNGITTYKLTEDGELELICNTSDQGLSGANYFLQFYETVPSYQYYFYYEYVWCGTGNCNLPRLKKIDLFNGNVVIIEPPLRANGMYPELCGGTVNWQAVGNGLIYIGAGLVAGKQRIDIYSYNLNTHTYIELPSWATDIVPFGGYRNFVSTIGMFQYYKDLGGGNYQYYISRSLSPIYTLPINVVPITIIEDIDYNTYLVCAYPFPTMSTLSNYLRIYKVLDSETFELKLEIYNAGNMTFGAASWKNIDKHIFLATDWGISGGASPSTTINIIYKINFLNFTYETLPISTNAGGGDAGTLDIYISDNILFCAGMHNYPALHVRVNYDIMNIYPGTGQDANPIEVLYDFMTNTRYGMGLDINLFDGSPYTSGSWKTEYDYCDEQIINDETGNYEPRFCYSNAFLVLKKGYDIIKDILQTCRGYISYCDGKIKVGIQKANEIPIIGFGYEEGIFLSNQDSNYYNRIYINFSNYTENYWNGDIGTVIVSGTFGDNYGGYGYGSEDEIPDVFEFIVIDQTETYIEVLDNFSYMIPNGCVVEIKKDNIKKNTFTWSDKDSRSKSNVLRLEYKKRDEKYRTDVVESNNYPDIQFLEDIKEISYSMPGIKRNFQARRMVQFLQDYIDMTMENCSFSTDIVGMLLCIGDIISVTYELKNWQCKLFRVISLEEQEDYDVKLELEEYNSFIFHDYAVSSVTTTSYFDFVDQNEIPDQVERLFLFQDIYKNKIYPLFKKPENNNTYWIGGIIYKKYSDEQEWSCVGISYLNSPSVKLISNINNYQTIIPYDLTTINLSFPIIGSFFIEEEEIYYNGIDIINNQFLNCIRGYNNTMPAFHFSNEYCYYRSSNMFSINYKQSDIGKTLSIKVISITIYNKPSNGLEAPEESIDLVYSSDIPYFVSDLKCTPLFVIGYAGDFVVSWQCVSKSINCGYGGEEYGGGQGYGGGRTNDVVKYYIEIWNNITNIIIRSNYLNIDDFESPDYSYTYTSILNILDNIIYNGYLKFRIYQIDIFGNTSKYLECSTNIKYDSNYCNYAGNWTLSSGTNFTEGYISHTTYGAYAYTKDNIIPSGDKIVTFAFRDTDNNPYDLYSIILDYIDGSTQSLYILWNNATFSIYLRYGWGDSYIGNYYTKQNYNYSYNWINIKLQKIGLMVYFKSWLDIIEDEPSSWDWSGIVASEIFDYGKIYSHASQIGTHGSGLKNIKILT